MAFRVLLVLAACALAAGVASGTVNGIDFIDPVGPANLKCLMNIQNYMVTRIFHDGGGGGCDLARNTR